MPQLRPSLLLLFCFSSLFVLAELILLEHYRDLYQLPPMILLGAGFALSGIALLGVGAAAPWRLVFRWMAGFYFASGIVGALLHLRGNLEFQLERRRDIEGLELLWRTLKGAFPVLAPGTMILLGCILWLAVWDRSRRPPASNQPL